MNNLDKYKDLVLELQVKVIDLEAKDKELRKELATTVQERDEEEQVVLKLKAKVGHLEEQVKHWQAKYKNKIYAND